MKPRPVILCAAFVLTALACSLPSWPGSADPPAGEGAAAPTSEAAQPVNIVEGLASLDSYRSVITVNTTGPDPASSTTVTIETLRSQTQDARYSQVTMTQLNQDYPEPATTDYEIYRIGYDQCTKTEDGWAWTSLAPNEAEMLNVVLSMVNFTPIINDPTLVAAETMNGIATNHYSFKMAGLGVKSGAEVTSNQGDYWLAVDGRYIVKYTLVLETVAAPQADVIHMETSIEVTDINQPVDIAFPTACHAAAPETPSPEATP